MRPLLAFLLLAASCSGEAKTDPCEEFGVLTDSGCVGVASPTICGDRFCIPPEAPCAATYFVEEGAAGSGSKGDPLGDLPQAATLASAGDCVAIAEGSYTGTRFAGGVSLFGSGAGRVEVAGGAARATLELGAGAGSWIRGLRVGGPELGIRVEGATAVRIEQVAVDGSGRAGIVAIDTEAELRSVLVRNVAGEPGHGIFSRAEVGRSLLVVDTLVESNAAVGIVVIGAPLDMESSVVRTNGSYGVAIQGGSGTSTIDSTLVSENTVVGVLASATRLRMEGVEISGTRSENGLALLVSVQEAADVDLVGANLRESEKYGVLVDDSRLLMEGGECSGNEERGFWIQNVGGELVDGRSVLLDGVAVQDNGFAGIYGTKESAGLVIQNGIVSGTRIVAVPADGATIRAGDGIHVTGGADLVAAGLTLQDNERAAAVFDGATGGVTGSVIDAPEDEAGLVIQNGVPADGFDGNTDPEGNPVDPITPSTPLDITTAEAETLTLLTATEF